MQPPEGRRVEGQGLSSALLGWAQPRVSEGPALEDSTRAIALVALMLMVPALYMDMPSYIALLASRSHVLPLIPVEASGVVSVLMGALLYLLGAYTSDVAAPLDAIPRRRFYSIAAAAIGLCVLLVGVLLPEAIWELMLLLLYCLPGIIGVYAVALGSDKLAYVLFVLVAAAVFVDRTFPSGWVGPAVLGGSLILFLECMDAHRRLTLAMRAELAVQRGLAGGGAPEDVVRANYLVVQGRFNLVLGRTVALAAAVSLAAVASMGLAAWATGGALPHSLEAGSMAGLAVPVLAAIVLMLTYNIHRSGLKDLYTGKGVPIPLEAGPAWPLVGPLGEHEGGEGGPAPPEGLLGRLRKVPWGVRRLLVLRRKVPETGTTQATDPE